MCRLLAYVGPPVLMADVVLWPDRSIIKQSYDARERRHDASLASHLAHGNLNGDGFGIGWFPPAAGADPTPCVYTSITPAWCGRGVGWCGGGGRGLPRPRLHEPARPPRGSGIHARLAAPKPAPNPPPFRNNENLGRLARKISSPLVFAHVRAAMPGMAVNEQNCHPFAHGRYMWMHNGVVGGFMAVRRALVSGLSDAAYDSIQSFHSDSSVAFAVFLHHLPDLDSPQPPAVLLTALQATLDTISSAQAAAGVTETSLLNFAVSDGDTLLATRYVSSADPAEAPASLYYAEGAEFHRSSPIGGGANGGGAKGAPAPPAPPAAAAFSPAKPPNLPGTSPRASATASALAQEGEYSLTYGDAGTRTVLVASEPITRSKGDWVAVPRNTALVVSREKGRFINVMLAPLGGGACASGGAADVAACLEAVCGAAEVPARPFRDGRRMDRRGDDARPRSSSLGPGAASGGDETPGGRRGARATSCGPAPRTNDHRLTGHAGPVLCMAQRGNLVFSGSVDRTVKARQSARRLGSGWVDGPALSPPAHHPTPPHIRHPPVRLQVWDLTTFECVRTLAGHGKPVQRLAVAGHLLYSAGGRRVRAWDVRTWACVHELALPEASGSIFGLAVCDAGVVYVAGQDAVVRAYKGAAEWLEEVGGTNGAGPGKASVACPAPPLALSHMPHPIEASARSPPGGGHCSAVCSLAVVCGLVCSAGGDATIRVWREGSLAPVGVLRGHRGSVLTLFALRGLLLSGGRDNIIRVWDLDGMLCRQTLAGHQDDVLALSGVLAAGWDGDPAGDSPAAFEARASAAGDRGALFASASADGTVRVWSAERWACVRVLAAGVPSVPGEAVTDLPFLSIEQTPDAVVAGASDGQLRVWALDAGNAAACARPPSVAAYDGARPAKRVRSAAVLGPPAGPVRLDAELERSLREFVRLRTVSADPSAREACFRGAKFLARQLESLGAEIKLVRPADDRNPVVLGRLGRNPALPTVTFYGHYDVQPAMEREWATDPFEVCSVDGYLYGRGTSDNKGPILAFLYAVKELIAETGSGAGGPQGASPRAAAAAGANGATAPSPNGGSAHAAGPPPPPCPPPPPPPRPRRPSAPCKCPQVPGPAPGPP